MRKYLLATLLFAIVPWGCSPAFWGGTATGVAATGAGYEINAKRQMDRLEDDFRKERISRREYEERKRQIEKGSILY